jgi:hypothetical protein
VSFGKRGGLELEQWIPSKQNPSESKYWPRQHFSLGSCSSTDVNNATSTANKRHFRICNNRQPFCLNFETEMATGVESDSAPNSKGETYEAEIRATGNVRSPDAGQYERDGIDVSQRLVFHNQDRAGEDRRGNGHRRPE